jgi:hypothetical protein
MTDALATITAALVIDATDAPDQRLMRTALRQYLLPPAVRTLPRPAEIEAVVLWLNRSSLPLSELIKPRRLRAGLDALAVTMDGAAAAPTTIRRKRAVFNNALQYAVEIEQISANKLNQVGWRIPRSQKLSTAAW